MKEKQQTGPQKKARAEKPLRLTPGEMKAPISVSKEFFSIYNLLAAHDHFTLLLNNLPDNNPDSLNAIEFVGDVEKLLEANFFLIKKSVKRVKRVK
ncbi:hypothetical protein FHW36_101599 [Chitinophaga polysaccharea]|uniref:Uncharacterized protein n=1 Tax=Chitinophaga polysaccharea TaxID=1293035 RepID=A0A561Q2T0_9BACT|nr:hypothetical protein [Chitinophaga polysaccharea]TWF44678.1 hypothetical protein FHW36_101599 [Chitinophaga polysaccharea]